VIAGLAVVGSAAGQAAANRVQLADAAIAEQSTDPAEVLVATLLAAGLKDALVVLNWAMVITRTGVSDLCALRLLSWPLRSIRPKQATPTAEMP